MPSLTVIEPALDAHPDGDEAVIVVRVLQRMLDELRPSRLARVNAEWQPPFLTVELIHEDGTVLEVTDGDSYTVVRSDSGDVDYHGYLTADELLVVVRGALEGGLTYARHRRLGITVADYFDVEGRATRLGFARYGLAGAPGAVLRAVPLVPESVVRVRVAFNRTPGTSLRS